MKHRRLIISLFEMLGIAAAVYAALHAQAVYDYWMLRDYQPPAQIARFAESTSMSAQARQIFYVSRPVVDDKASFAANCDVRESDTLELGCFNHKHIYILRVSTPELVSVMDVTAAHEMLHAAYARLSKKDRTTLDAQLEVAAGKISDPDLRALLDQYASSEPGERANELHSLLGTEYSNLGPELEAYYAKYFEDRRRVVAASNRFKQAFDSRRQALETQAREIDTSKAQLSSINGQLDRYRASGNIEAYNALVPTQNRLVAELRAKIDSYNELVDDYNRLSRSFNSLKIENIQQP